MKWLVNLMLLFLSAWCFSQEPSDNISKENQKVNYARNSIYLECLGTGLFSSLNYDRLFNTSKKLVNSYSIGFSYWGKIKEAESSRLYLGIPISYNFLFGKKNNHFEIGTAITLSYLRVTENISTFDEELLLSLFSIKLGYRYQKPLGGIFFRATLTPFIYGTDFYKRNKSNTDYSELNKEVYSSMGFQPWAGISIGYTFKK